MLGKDNFFSIQASVMGDLDKYMPIMIQLKSSIQGTVSLMLSSEETQDIKECRLNMNVVNKLAVIGRLQYANKPQDEILYCICVAIGTIIKEYDWGIKYLQLDGICELASKITSS